MGTLPGYFVPASDREESMINRPGSLAGRGSVAVERCQGAPRRQAAGAQTRLAGGKLVSSPRSLLRWGAISPASPAVGSHRLLTPGECFPSGPLFLSRR